MAGEQAAPPVSGPYGQSAEEVLRSLGGISRSGLTAAAARERLARDGLNELAREAPQPVWRRFLGQFKDLMIWLLLAAAICAGFLGEWTDAGAILAIVVLNGVIGFLQEEKAARALAALEKLSAPLARVVRDGQLQMVPAREVVVGDRLELEAGDYVPADARLLETAGLRAQEAALTGESEPVDKDARDVLPAAAALADRTNMVHMGTVVSAGKASAVVTATGMATELGSIAGLLGRHRPEPTPLQRRMSGLGKLLVGACLILVTVIFFLELRRGGALGEVFLRAVSLAVAAVPEGLPAVVTLVLALGLQRLARVHVLVRKLPSVETLGSVTVICTDKTGTLTRNEMTVRVLYAGGQWYRVEGSGYSPSGRLLKASQTEVGDEHLADGPAAGVWVPADPANEPDLREALLTGVLCNHAELKPPTPPGGGWEAIGDPTEVALLVAARKAGIDRPSGRGKIVFEIPFDSERKAMSVVWEQDGSRRMHTKGAPDVLLGKCRAERRGGRVVVLDDVRRREILDINARLASQAYRVLALAQGDAPAGVDPVEESLVLVGLAAILDPPREEAKAAVERCRQAGIRPVMITGDHPATALAIGRGLGLVEPGDRAVTGQDLDRLAERDLESQIERIPVYARVTAEHKLKVVRAWKSRGDVVAMTGDGVNDAPAIQAADIGIAMGRSGTDVTREAADMVLTDDNFASIVRGVEEGRGIYDNIQKFVHYLLSCNASELLFMLFASIVGWPAPLSAVQILWINLVTDGLPALALGTEAPEPDVMRRRPRSPGSSVIDRSEGVAILVHGVLLSLAALAGFGWTQWQQSSLEHSRTVAFLVVSFAQLFFALSCRSRRYTMPQLGFFSNSRLNLALLVSGLLQVAAVVLPWAQPFFGAVSPTPAEWGISLGLALAPVSLVELYKIARSAARDLPPGAGSST